MKLTVGIFAMILSCGLLASCPGSRKAEPPARLTLLVSGNTMGYLRNCGCASGQFGGELRRARLLKQEREDAMKSKPTDKGRPSSVMSLDTGSTFGGKEYIDRLYSRQVMKSMAHTGYGMLGLGETDLLFGQNDLADYLQEVQEGNTDTEIPLTAVNLHFQKPSQGEDRSRELNEMIRRYRIEDVGNGFKVGVIHAIDPGVTIEIEDEDRVQDRYGFTIMPVAKSTQQVLDQHGSEADFWIFTLADGIEGVTDPQEIADIEELDLVIGFTGGNPNQTSQSGAVVYPYFVEGPVLKARDLMKIVINFPQSQDDDMTIVKQRMLVGSRIKGDAKVLELIEEIWPEIEKWENEKLGTQTTKLQPNVVGQDNCITCHANILATMKQTRHQHAFLSLEHVARTDPERKNAHRDPKCLSCHVTEYISPNGGWNKLDKQPELAMVSCESCHGPGQYHVQIKSGLPVPDDLMADGRNEHGLLPASSETCLKCHDAENSPRFDFDEYWEKISHSIDMPMPEESTADTAESAH